MNQELSPFDSDDRIALTTFLNTRTGQRMIQRLWATSPPLLRSGETNAILIRTGEVTGRSGTIQEIYAMTEPDPSPVSQASLYPSPEDDALWKDGKKVSST
jgi:hypothetical protein